MVDRKNVLNKSCMIRRGT